MWNNLVSVVFVLGSANMRVSRRACVWCGLFSASIICSGSDFCLIFFFFSFLFHSFVCYYLYFVLNRGDSSHTIELTMFVVWWWWHDCHPVILLPSYARELSLSLSFMIGQLSLPNSSIFAFHFEQLEIFRETNHNLQLIKWIFICVMWCDESSSAVVNMSLPIQLWIEKLEIVKLELNSRAIHRKER